MTKHFDISKEVVHQAYLKVKANKGAAGVDGESIAEFEKNLEGNLYKIWNRMSSGTYFPPAVRNVEIPKKNGKGVRMLGVPTVADRVAQMVVKLYLEPEVEPKFHTDSYGYRPNKSALDAVGKARERCWQNDWTIDLDIAKFFDELDHNLVLEMVKKHTDCRWILIYIERWLKAPIQMEDGTLIQRDVGSAQGSVISPLLSNIVMHHVFDKWMESKFPNIPFERYADDGLAHCKTKKQAEYVKEAIAKRLEQHKLKLNQEKTQIVYSGSQRGKYNNDHFDFLGYTFRKRTARSNRGQIFISFIPAISDKAAKTIRQTIRGWRIHLRSGQNLEDIAMYINPIVRGWLNYYGRYYKSAMSGALFTINRYLLKWTHRKYKRFKFGYRKAWRWLGRIAATKPDLFAHWQYGMKPKS